MSDTVSPYHPFIFVQHANILMIIDMEKHKKRISIRLDERTAMLLDELSNITKTNTSVIIRGMVHRSIEELIDKSGNWKMPNEKDKKRKA